jgi:hypothetical protein
LPTGALSDPDKETSTIRLFCRTGSRSEAQRELPRLPDLHLDTRYREGKHLTEWRKQREGGSLAGLAAKKRGPKSRKNPLADENARLQRENERMKAELAKANTVIDVQRKVAALLGETLPEPTEEEIVLGRGRFRTGRLDINTGRRS